MSKSGRSFVVSVVVAAWATLSTTSPQPLDACTGSPCQSTGPLAVVVESICAPVSRDAQSTVVVPFRVLNTSMRCTNVTLDVTLRVIAIGGTAPIVAQLPLGSGDTEIPSNPVRIAAHAGETGTISIRYAAGATGAGTFRLEAEAPGFPIAARQFSVTLLNTFYVDKNPGNAAAAPGVERQLTWTIVNPGTRSRTISYAIRVLQTSSSVNPLMDRFPVADCAASLPAGDPTNTDGTNPDFLIISQTTIPGHSSFPVCVRTASYAACQEGANCLYRMTASESLSGESGDSNQNLSVIESDFALDGGVAISPTQTPAIGGVGLALLALLVAAGGALVIRRSSPSPL
ncbi:MAG: hypothetical protein HY292_01725 [Planctomycetes bacterium]|nr:hypothetical protein [Planctomycetota bacterium]